MKLKTIAIALCSAAFVSGAFAQHANFNNPKLQALVAKSAELKTCVEGNKKLDVEIDQAFAKAKAAGEITTAEAAKFKTMEANIAKHRAALAKDGFSVADCKTMTADYNKEKSAVEAMATNKAQLNTCATANSAKHKANMDAMAKARAGKKITPAEEAEFKKFEQSASKHLADMKKDGYSIQDCNARTKDLGDEAALIAKISK